MDELAAAVGRIGGQVTDLVRQMRSLRSQCVNDKSDAADRMEAIERRLKILEQADGP